MPAISQRGHFHYYWISTKIVTSISYILTLKGASFSDTCPKTFFVKHKKNTFGKFYSLKNDFSITYT